MVCTNCARIWQETGVCPDHYNRGNIATCPEAHHRNCYCVRCRRARAEEHERVARVEEHERATRVASIPRPIPLPVTTPAPAPTPIPRPSYPPSPSC